MECCEGNIAEKPIGNKNKGFDFLTRFKISVFTDILVCEIAYFRVLPPIFHFTDPLLVTCSASTMTTELLMKPRPMVE